MSLSKHQQFQMYCSNLTNYLPSYERLKTQSNHHRVLSENLSYFKLKKIEHKGVLRKKNLIRFLSNSKSFKEVQLNHDNNLIYNNINQIASKKPVRAYSKILGGSLR